MWGENFEILDLEPFQPGIEDLHLLIWISNPGRIGIESGVGSLLGEFGL